MSIGSISSEIGKIRCVSLAGRRRMMDFGIDTAKQRNYASCSESVLQRHQRSATRVAQHQIEISQLARTDISELLAVLECFERDGRVEIVENAQVDIR